MLPSLLLSAAFLLTTAHADLLHDSCLTKRQAAPVTSGEGSISGPTTSTEAAGYSCDTSKCKLPDCNCASASPPGGLNPKDVPQFIVFTADDAVQSFTIDSVNQFLAQRKNPNGCKPKMTFYTSLNYTNYTLVTDWYVAGNEIADHTMTHVGTPSKEEVNGNLMALNAFSGIPFQAIRGFRAPFLNYSKDTLQILHDAAFTYDSSASASVPVTDPNTDAYWPYTLDYGMANDCLMVSGICKGEPKLPGFWEVPMYSFFDKKGAAGPHLMDPWLDAANGNSNPDDQATLDFMKDTFNAHYNGNRQPIGLYTHPIHLANYPGVNVKNSTIQMINNFLDWAQQQPNVWIVSTEQLLEWTRNPQPVSNLESVGALKCSTPNVDSSKKICNGMPQNQAGLLNKCQFTEYTWYTCYGCPKEQPSVSNPNPEQNVQDGQQARFHLPANCSTPFWDPVAGQCTCQASDCQFNDASRPIGPNGANLTGGGQGGANSNPTYVPFNGKAVHVISQGWVPTLVLGLAGAMVGALGVFGRM